MTPSRFTPQTGLPALDAARFSTAQHHRALLPLGPRFGIAVQDNRHTPAGAYEVEVPPLSHHILVFPLRRSFEGTRLRVAGSWQQVPARVDQFMFFPAGVDLLAQATQGRDRLLHIHLTPGWVEEMAEEAGARPALRPSPDLCDASIASLCRRMAAVLDAEGPLSPALAEQAVVMTALELLRLQGAGTTARHHITPARMRAVHAHIEERLAEPLSLGELAGVARLSRFHFLRCFRAETGLTPQAYVLQRRVERAMRLILEGRLSLAEVAIACGFAHQAHFTTAFRRIVGAPPGRWRTEQRS